MITHNSQKEDIEEQKQIFVASLGHDLKNPTIAQIRALELLLKGQFGELSLEQKEIIEMLLDSCRYMQAMLSSLLSTYRYEQGKIKLCYTEFSLSELINESIEEMVYLAKDKNVMFSLNDNCQDIDVNADKIQIKRVIMNLLSNGIKYAYKDSVVKIFVYKENGMACFKFENNSPYISEDQRKLIFSQYVSFAEAHKVLGIGLGLYASKKIVEAHSGTIFVESFEDERNIFGFKIPLNVDTSTKERNIIF